MEISKEFKPGVYGVYIATGMDYPDALIAAAAAGGKAVVSDSVKSEIAKLAKLENVE